MTIRLAVCSALALALTTSAWSADKAPPLKDRKPAAKAAKAPAKTVAKAPGKPVVKASAKTAATAPRKAVTNTPAKAPLKAAPKIARLSTSRPPPQALLKTSFKPAAAAPSPVLHGPKEVLTCRDGTEDRHARIAVVTVGGTPESFAYYSKWKPRTCSIYLQRNRDASKWIDKGGVTNVSTDRGLFLIERDKGEYRFVFRDVDRERYCGMDGTINGTLTIRKGSERCEVAGIMEEGVPLGQAVAYMEMEQNAQQAAAAPSAPAQAAPARPRHALEPPRRDPASPFPAAAVGLSD
ncbi:MAG: hypothetical protein JWM26_2677 [Betaproteobacteria bacterium]|nr:hypothetical protein [Betaproteobacteria bacterium]